MSELSDALEECGGPRAGREHAARLRALVASELERGARELAQPRSGYGDPVAVVVAPGERALLAVAPADAALRADPDAAGERTWLVVAALVGALVEAGGAPPPARAEDLALRAADAGGRLALELPLAPGERDAPGDAELAAVSFDERVAAVDRLRARALAAPAHALPPIGELRPPIGATHPLRIAEAVARLGGRPAEEASLAAYEDAVLALLGAGLGPPAPARPHDDPDPARRAARRILQRLSGMGKWGGYHTEFAHLARGFAGHEQGLALEVGEKLLDAGLLAEKPSVGQRHVFLNPRRKADIDALVDRGELPPGVDLP